MRVRSEQIQRRIEHGKPCGRFLVFINGRFHQVACAQIATASEQAVLQTIVGHKPQQYQRDVRDGDVVSFLSEQDRDKYNAKVAKRMARKEHVAETV